MDGVRCVSFRVIKNLNLQIEDLPNATLSCIIITKATDSFSNII